MNENCYIEIVSPKYGVFKVLVDLDDYEKIKYYKWHVRKCYSQNHECYYIGAAIDGKTVLLHRFIMKATKGEFVDHINHDTLDNRKKSKNLYICRE